MADLSWLQIAGAMAGGLVGSFSGFIANSFHEHRVRHRIRQNLACAVIGEISALTEQIEQAYIALLRADVEAGAAAGRYPHFHFRGDRDYMSVFRGIGGDVGHLPTPLPRDLVSWYTKFATMLERARALNDLAARGDPTELDHAIDLARMQQSSLDELVAAAKPLLEQLARL